MLVLVHNLHGNLILSSLTKLNSKKIELNSQILAVIFNLNVTKASQHIQ